VICWPDDVISPPSDKTADNFRHIVLSAVHHRHKITHRHEALSTGGPSSFVHLSIRSFVRPSVRLSFSCLSQCQDQKLYVGYLKLFTPRTFGRIDK